MAKKDLLIGQKNGQKLKILHFPHQYILHKVWSNVEQIGDIDRMELFLIIFL